MKIKAIILIFFFLFSAAGASMRAQAQEYGEESKALGQFVDDFENLDNVSVTVDVVRNSTYNAMELNFTVGADGTEDLTTYTKVDGAGDLTVTIPRVSWSSMRRDANAVIWRDNGVDFFGDFEIKFTFNLTDVEAGDASGRGIMHIFAVGNNAGGAEAIFVDLVWIEIIQNGAVDDQWKFRLGQALGGVSQFSGVGGTRGIGTFYITLDRVGTVLRLRTYTDFARTNLIETITDATTDTTAYRYDAVAIGYQGGADPADHSSGYVELIDLGAGAASGYESPGYFTTTNYLNDVFANGSSLVQMTNATIPANTGITVQFSDDNSTWVNSGGAAGFNTLTAGFFSIDLRDLNWSVVYHLRYNLSTSDPAITPRLYQSRLITTIGNASSITEIQNVSGTWIEYNLAEFNASVGTVDAGLLNSTFSIDGIMFNVSEVVGVPGMMLSGNFTDVDDDAISLWVLIYAHYDGNLNHDFDIEVWDFENSVWVEDDHITDVLELTFFNSTIYRLRIPANFLSNGEVRIRLDHESAGNINHDLMIDQIQLQAFIPSAAAEEPFQFFWIVIGIALMIIGIVLARMWPEEGDP